MTDSTVTSEVNGITYTITENTAGLRIQTSSTQSGKVYSVMTIPTPAVKALGILYGRVVLPAEKKKPGRPKKDAA